MRGAAGRGRDSRPGGTDQQPDGYEVARGYVLSALARGPRTRYQLATMLTGKGVEPEVAEAVVDRFAAVDLVDDAAYAEAWVRARHDGRGLSRRAVARELAVRGVDDEITTAALSQIDAHAEEERARELVDAKLRGTRGLPVATRTRRLVGMLARKGYPPGLATRVVREQLALEPDVDPVDQRFLDGLDAPLSELAEQGE